MLWIETGFFLVVMIVTLFCLPFFLTAPFDDALLRTKLAIMTTGMLWCFLAPIMLGLACLYRHFTGKE